MTTSPKRIRVIRFWWVSDLRRTDGRRPRDSWLIASRRSAYPPRLTRMRSQRFLSKSAASAPGRRAARRLPRGHPDARARRRARLTGRKRRDVTVHSLVVIVGPITIIVLLLLIRLFFLSANDRRVPAGWRLVTVASRSLGRSQASWRPPPLDYVWSVAVGIGRSARSCRPSLLCSRTQTAGVWRPRDGLNLRAGQLLWASMLINARHRRDPRDRAHCKICLRCLGDDAVPGLLADVRWCTVPAHAG